MSNGVNNGKFIFDQYDWYYFNATVPGKYSISLDSDGFLQGNVFITDSRDYGLSDFSYLDFFVENNSSQVTYSYDKHLNSSKNFKETFTIKTAGKYYIKVQKAAFTAGSYKFTITPPAAPKTVTVKSLQAEKAVLNMKIGIAITNKIFATYSDGSKKDITKLVSLTSSNPSIAIYKNISLKAKAKGSAVITVKYQKIKTTFTAIAK
jgi:hypothetical protein